jgi:two-component system, LytTR family, response regulator
MLKTIIVYDKKPAKDLICRLLSDHCKEVEVIGTFSTVGSAYEAIKDHNPELVMLDIELPDGNGFDLLRMIDRIDFSVIFMTAYPEFAFKAFKYNAVDYLLKPVKIDELKIAIGKVLKINRDIDLIGELYRNINLLLRNISDQNSIDQNIVIPHLKGFDVLKINDIIMCEADSYCTSFYLTGKRNIISSKNLKQYEDILKSHKFLRVHHSYLINLGHVCSYTKQGEIILTEKNKACLGESFRQQFLKNFIKKLNNSTV